MARLLDLPVEVILLIVDYLQTGTKQGHHGEASAATAKSES